MEPTPGSEYHGGGCVWCEQLRADKPRADTLRAEIAVAAAELDRRNGTPAGTAARAIYAYYWAVDPISVDVLTNLRNDALAFLAVAVAA